MLPGLAQIFGASLAFGLIAAQGVTGIALVVFAATTACTGLSILLFRVQKRDRR